MTSWEAVCPICSRSIFYDAQDRAWRCELNHRAQQLRLKPEDIKISVEDHAVRRVEFDSLKSTLCALDKIPDSQIKTVLQPIYEYLYRRGCRINR